MDGGEWNMIRIMEITNPAPIYKYQMCIPAPYFFPQNFTTWEKSFAGDTDGDGRTLFKELFVKAAYEDEKLLGFIQYGESAFGFDEQGNISSEVSYQIIRNLYFDPDRADAGTQLLKEALDQFDRRKKVYAFFHYFGMSCYARHGKLFEGQVHVEALLKRNGFETEHENVYYSSVLDGKDDSEAQVFPHEMTKGNQQYLDFLLSGDPVGGCEVHFVDDKIAYLRWIYVNENIAGKGIGSKCMRALKHWLYQKGITKFDTDTAISNHTAQHFYEKNGFTREGITRSFYLT